MCSFGHDCTLGELLITSYLTRRMTKISYLIGGIILFYNSDEIK